MVRTLFRFHTHVNGILQSLMRTAELCRGKGNPDVWAEDIAKQGASDEETCCAFEETLQERRGQSRSRRATSQDRAVGDEDERDDQLMNYGDARVVGAEERENGTELGKVGGS